MRRIRKLVLEAQDAGFTPLYEGANTTEDAVAYLAAWGFALNAEESSLENEAVGEWNLVFDRDDDWRAAGA